MFKQELPQRNSPLLNVEQIHTPTLQANILQAKLAEHMQVSLVDFIINYAEVFRNQLDVHPEWLGLYKKDPEDTIRIIRELLEGETVH
jgi:hypothetical protein